MTVIAITNVAKKANKTQVVKSLVRAIRGQFEALSLQQTKSDKICYIRLSDKLDPRHVVAKIKSETRYGAYVVPPDRMPNLPEKASKAGQIPLRTRIALRITADDKPEQVLVTTHNEILVEMQSKFTGLYNLSNKTNHKLLDNIAQILFERLKTIIESNSGACENGFKLSQSYRRLHPHFGDFQLILSNLHAIQDAAGEPRTHLQESELTTVTVQPYAFDNNPCNKVVNACDKYSQRIVLKIKEHIKGLKSDGDQADGLEESARKSVRQQLKKLSPYMPLIVKQVISNHFLPPKSGFHRMRESSGNGTNLIEDMAEDANTEERLRQMFGGCYRYTSSMALAYSLKIVNSEMYGEPFLPAKEQLAPLLKRQRAVKVVRSDRMYNVLRFNVPPAQCAAAMALDGTVINGAKLVVRSSDMPLHAAREGLRADMFALFGAQAEGACEPIDDE